MSYSAAVLTDTPLVYYRLGESSGTTATDSSGNGRDGSINNNGGSWTLGAAGALGGSGDSDTAIAKTGTDPTVVAPAGAHFNFGTGDFSAEIWYKGTDSTATTVLIGSTSSLWYLGIVSGKVRIYCGSSHDSSGSVNDGNWHHIVATRISGSTRIYIDGSLDASGAVSNAGSIGSSGTAVGIAALEGGTFGIPGGTYDEAAIYGSGLSGTRVTAHYDAGTSGGGALTAGTASVTSFGLTTATVTATDATGGTESYTYQWQRSTTSGSGFSNVSGATSLTLNDTGLTRGTTYYYQLVYDDGVDTVTSSEISLTTRSKQLVADGTSQTVGSGGATSWATLIQSMIGTSWQINNEAVGGQTTADMNSDYGTEIAPYYSASNTENLVAFDAPLNDIYFNATAQDAYDEVRAYCEAARSTGFSVMVILAQPDRGDFSGSSTLPGADAAAKRAEYVSRYADFKALFLADWYEFCDAFVDPFSDVRIVVDDTTYIQSDDVHWTTTTETIVAQQVTGALLMALNPNPGGGGGATGTGLHAIELGGV